MRRNSVGSSPVSVARLLDLRTEILDARLLLGDELLPPLGGKIGDAADPVRVELGALVFLDEGFAGDLVAFGEPQEPPLERDEALVDVVELLDQRIDAVLVEGERLHRGDDLFLQLLVAALLRAARGSCCRASARRPDPAGGGASCTRRRPCRTSRRRRASAPLPSPRATWRFRIRPRPPRPRLRGARAPAPPRRHRPARSAARRRAWRRLRPAAAPASGTAPGGRRFPAGSAPGWARSWPRARRRWLRDR